MKYPNCHWPQYYVNRSVLEAKGVLGVFPFDIILKSNVLLSLEVLLLLPVLKDASDLSISQSHKVSFEMFAPSIQQFVEVGDVSAFGQYLSKRLMLKYEDGTSLKNLFVVSGTAINVTKVIACMLEQTQGNLIDGLV